MWLSTNKKKPDLRGGAARGVFVPHVQGNGGGGREIKNVGFLPIFLFITKNYGKIVDGIIIRAKGEGRRAKGHDCVRLLGAGTFRTERPPDFPVTRTGLVLPCPIRRFSGFFTFTSSGSLLWRFSRLAARPHHRATATTGIWPLAFECRVRDWWSRKASLTDGSCFAHSPPTSPGTKAFSSLSASLGNTEDRSGTGPGPPFPVSCSAYPELASGIAPAHHVGNPPHVDGVHIVSGPAG